MTCMTPAKVVLRHSCHKVTRRGTSRRRSGVDVVVARAVRECVQGTAEAEAMEEGGERTQQRVR